MTITYNMVIFKVDEKDRKLLLARKPVLLETGRLLVANIRYWYSPDVLD